MGRVPCPVWVGMASTDALVVVFSSWAGQPGQCLIPLVLTSWPGTAGRREGRWAGGGGGR